MPRVSGEKPLPIYGDHSPGLEPKPLPIYGDHAPGLEPGA